MDIQALLDKSCEEHSRLCPRQVLGVRIGLAGLAALGAAWPPAQKSLLTIVESDGCFADGVSVATGCTVGHRTLRVEDYGKVGATLVRVDSGRAVRVAPVLDARDRAAAWLPAERRRYFAQLQAYQTLPDDQLVTVTEVQLRIPVEQLISRPGLRVNCSACGEEIINERQVIVGGRIFCRACAGHAYYLTELHEPAFVLPAPSDRQPS